MSKAKKKNQEPPSPSDFQRFTSMLGRICLLGAIGLSCYLAFKSISGGALAGCDEGSSCDEVLSSKWSYVLGVVPVSILAVLTYAALLFTDIKACCPRVHAILRWMIIGAAVWFVALQALVVKNFCGWCCTTHSVAVLGALLLGLSQRKAGAPAKKWLAPALGAAGVAGLALVQAFGPERPTTAGGQVAEGEGTQVAAPVPEGPRTVSLHKGKFVIDVADYPAIGDVKKAPHVALGLFDFTCPHCRELTEMLTKLEKEFAGQFAVVQLPGHFAAKGLAIHKILTPVWRENPEAYHQVADLLHTGALQALPDQVKLATATQVGSEELLSEWMAKHASWTQDALTQTQEIRAANKAITKTGKFPQLMIGDYIEAGNKTFEGHYYELLNKHFGIKRGVIPEIACEPRKVDLGKVWAGATQRIEITVSNPGKHPLKISDVRATTGMRVMSKPPPVLAPGANGKIAVVGMPPRPGALDGKISILSNAEPSTLEIPIKAEVSHPYTVNPSFIDFGNFQGPPITKTTTLTFVEAVTLGQPKANNPTEFTAALEEIEKGRLFKLTVTAKPNLARRSTRRGAVVIPVRANNAEVPWPTRLSVPYRCQVGATPPTRKPPTAKPPARGPSGSRPATKPPTNPPPRRSTGGDPTIKPPGLPD